MTIDAVLRLLARLILHILGLLLFRPTLAPVRNLKGEVHMATVTLNWSAPAPVAPNPVDVLNIQIRDKGPGQPPVDIVIGTVAPGVTTFTTGQLAPGDHEFTAVAVYGEGPAAPSNVFSASVVVVLAPVTNLTGTLNS